jgi:hypothetical protein
VERHPLGTNTKDLGVRPRGVAQSKSSRADLFCGNVQPQGRKGRDVEVVERHQNLWDFLEGLLKLHDVLEVPLSFTIFEGLKGVIISSNSVIASLDMHLDRSLVGQCKPTAKPSQAASRPAMKLAIVDALALAEMGSKQREIAETSEVPTG